MTAQVLRLLDTPLGVAKKEQFAVKGRKRHQPLAEAVAGARAIAGRSGGVWGRAPVTRRTPLPRAYEEQPLSRNGRSAHEKSPAEAELFKGSGVFYLYKKRLMDIFGVFSKGWAWSSTFEIWL